MHFDWSFFEHLLFHPPSSFVQGAIRTIYLAVIAQALGVVLGLVLALMRRSRRLPLQRSIGATVTPALATPSIAPGTRSPSGAASVKRACE